LRSKLLISFVFLIAGLTIASLLVLRHNAEAQVQQEMERDARNATLTFQTVQRQEQTALSRKADLLASLAFMRNGDASAITDASEDPWQSEDCSLFALADRSGKIVALHSTGPSLPLESAQELVSLSVKRGEHCIRWCCIPLTTARRRGTCWARSSWATGWMRAPLGILAGLHPAKSCSAMAMTLP
jgi:hypothetical protein